MKGRFSHFSVAALSVAIGLSPSLSLADVTAKFTTDYERGQGANGTVTNINREPLWAKQDMVGEGISETVLSASTPMEASVVEFAGNTTATASNLLTVFERMELDAEFQALLERVENGGALGDANYGHQGHLEDLNLRADQLEQLLNAAE